MTNSFRRLVPILALGCALALPQLANAQAPCFGDCNGDMMLTAGDLGRINGTILRCGPCPEGIPGGIAAGCAALANGCPAADFNTDGCLRASEISRAGQNILRFPNGCAPTPTPSIPLEESTPTPTLPAATETQVPSTPTITRTPTPATVCGNGFAEGAAECSTCPQDCTVQPCTVPSPSTKQAFRVNWAPPLGAEPSSVTAFVAYRSNLVSIPGTAAAMSVRQSVTLTPSNSIVSVNDFEYGLRVVVTRSGSINAGRLFQANFDRCSGAAAPTPQDFVCFIEGCASSAGDVPGCTCTVVTP